MVTTCSTDSNGMRWYETHDGARYPSVTTVLGATAPRAWGLERWRANLGEHADAVTEVAAQRGKRLHSEVHYYFSTLEEPAEPSSWWASVAPLVKMLRSAALSWWCEESMVHEVDGYAGTPDLVIDLDGELVVFDWKSRLDAKPVPARTHEQMLQSAGYVDLAAHALARRPKRAVVVTALPHGASPIQTVVPLQTALPVWRERFAAFKDMHP